MSHIFNIVTASSFTQKYIILQQPNGMWKANLHAQINDALLEKK